MELTKKKLVDFVGEILQLVRVGAAILFFLGYKNILDWPLIVFESLTVNYRWFPFFFFLSLIVQWQLIVESVDDSCFFYCRVFTVGLHQHGTHHKRLTLVFTSLEREDAGNYICEARDVAGITFTKTVLVVPLGKHTDCCCMVQFVTEIKRRMLELKTGTNLMIYFSLNFEVLFTLLIIDFIE